MAKVAALAKGIRIGMLTTVDGSGHFVSRPMAQQEVEFDGSLWFFSERDARKVVHIAANPYVGVTLTSNDTGCRCPARRGRRRPGQGGRALERLGRGLVPQGPTDDNTVLVRFTPETAEYWDTRAAASPR